MIHNPNQYRKIKQTDKFLIRMQELAKETGFERLKWDVIYSTSEYNDNSEKESEVIDGKSYIVDECFVSYHCIYHGDEFLMITYEKIYSGNNGDDVRSTNMIFTPPLGIRYFDLAALAPYAIETDQILLYNAHQLWELILDLKKKKPEMVDLKVESRNTK